MLVFVLVVVLTMTGCSSDNGASSGSNETTTNFPDIGSIAEDVGPVLTASSPSSKLPGSGDGHVSFALTYDDDSEWSTYAAAGALKDVLGSPDEEPAPVTRIYVLIRSFQSTINQINQDHIDANGDFLDCTAVEVGAVVKTPWFTDNSQTAFFAFDDTDVYQCSYATDHGKVYFGRAAVESPPADCSTPYTYSFLEGSNLTEENTEMVEERGDTRTLSTAFKVFYDGCATTFKLVYAQATIYSAGVEFTSRSELTGNATTHEFQLRTLKRDVTLSPEEELSAGYFTAEAHGKSQSESDTSEYFIISYRVFDSEADTVPEPDKRFCIAVSGTDYDYTPVDSGCESYEEAFTAITPLTISEVPTAAFAAEF